MKSENELKTREPQYQVLVERMKEKGIARFGLMSSQVYFDDPKRLAFVLARYKFVSKMLSEKKRVCEVGCADAFGSPIVAKEVGSLTCVDFDPLFIEDAKDRIDPSLGIHFFQHDALESVIPEGPYDAVYACDVFEHIDPVFEREFIENILKGMTSRGVLILGIPSSESQAYASKQSLEGHVNCKSGDEFKTLLNEYFHNVFLFSMNDEVVHTGFHKMAHYLFAIGCDRK